MKTLINTWLKVLKIKNDSDGQTDDQKTQIEMSEEERFMVALIKKSNFIFEDIAELLDTILNTPDLPKSIPCTSSNFHFAQIYSHLVNGISETYRISQTESSGIVNQQLEVVCQNCWTTLSGEDVYQITQMSFFSDSKFKPYPLSPIHAFNMLSSTTSDCISCKKTSWLIRWTPLKANLRYHDKYWDSDLTGSALTAQKLYSGINSNNIHTINLAIASGADLNLPDESGKYPLHLACSVTDADTVRLLIANGAIIHQLTEDGNNSLYFALKAEKWDIVGQLIQLSTEEEIVYLIFNNKARDLIDKLERKQLEVLKKIIPAHPSNYGLYVVSIVDYTEIVSPRAVSSTSFCKIIQNKVGHIVSELTKDRRLAVLLEFPDGRGIWLKVWPDFVQCVGTSNPDLTYTLSISSIYPLEIPKGTIVSACSWEHYKCIAPWLVFLNKKLLFLFDKESKEDWINELPI